MTKKWHITKILFIFVLALVSIYFSSRSAASAEPKAGDVIDAGNVGQFKNYLPYFMVRWVEGSWGFESPIAITVKKPEDWPITSAFRKASEQNIGKVTLTSEGLIEGYTGVGVPFPNPKEPDLALKIMWNKFYMDLPEDWSLPDSFLVFSKRKGGSVSVYNSIYDCLKFSGRTIRPPLPELDNPNGLYWATILNSKTPPLKDMATLTWRYKDPTKYDDMWTYVPTLRRTLRMMSSERANPIQGSPSTWDEIWGFDGLIPLFTYRLLRKEKTLMIANMHTTADKLPDGMYNHPILFGQNDPYELVDAYVIEITSKDPRYPSSKWDFWVRDRHWAGFYAEIYDKRGEFWKSNTTSFIVRPLGNSKTDFYALRLGGGAVDYKTQYWTINFVGDLNTNTGLDQERFDPSIFGGGW
ncbi:MAG: DUF1329 domain-containing protein [Desulfobacterales bacterium]